MISLRQISKHAFYSVLCLLALIIFIVLINSLGLWSSLGLPHNTHWFIDFHALVSAAECDAQGLNTFLSNPCDDYDRVHVYSRAWFILDDIGISTRNQLFWGFIVSASFVITTLLVLKPENFFQCLVTIGLLISPAVLLGIERANNDLIVFCLLAMTCRLMTSSHRVQQSLSYLILCITAVLKFYPLIAFSMYIVSAKSNRQFWTITIVSTLLATLFIVLMWSDFQQLRLPSPSNRWTFGARYILQIPLPNIPFFTITIISWSLLICLAFILTKSSSVVAQSKTELKNLLTIAGSSIALFAFITANNYDYRCIFLLLCVPYMFEQLKHQEQRKAAGINIILILAIVWWEFVLQGSINLFDLKDTKSGLFLILRWIEQVLTWLLMTRLLWTLVSITKAPLLSRLQRNTT